MASESPGGPHVDRVAGGGARASKIAVGTGGGRSSSGTALTCRELVELITDYLEGALAPADRTRFETHLSGCRGCRTYLRQMRQTIRLAGRLSEDDLPEAMEQRLLHAFRAWKAGPPGSGAAEPHRGHTSTAATGAADRRSERLSAVRGRGGAAGAGDLIEDEEGRVRGRASRRGGRAARGCNVPPGCADDTADGNAGGGGRGPDSAPGSPRGHAPGWRRARLPPSRWG
jgi:Putative zinc-finger